MTLAAIIRPEAAETEAGSEEPADTRTTAQAGAGSGQVMPAPKSRQSIASMLPRLRDAAITGLALLLGVVFWQIATERDLQYIVNFSNVPGPLEVYEAFLANITDPVFHTHLLVSVKRVALSFALATAVGVPVGLLMGRLRLFRAMAMPYVEILRPIPAVAWIPLAILMWPTEESSIVYITFLGAVFPIVLNAMHGAEQTPEVLVRAVRSLGGSGLSIFWHVVLPAALPSVAAGLAIGMGVAWFSLLAGEIISGQYGIGYFTWDAYSMVRTPDIVVGMLMIGLLGSLSTNLVHRAMRPLLRWREKAR